MSDFFNQSFKLAQIINYGLDNIFCQITSERKIGVTPFLVDIKKIHKIFRLYLMYNRTINT